MQKSMPVTLQILESEADGGLFVLRYPDEVVITDEVAGTPGDGTPTPATENADDDFFSSWDKPAIKRPSNPPSRVGTPSAISRTGSPYLSAGGPNGAGARPKSPLNAASSPAEVAEASLPAPTAIRTTPATAIRKATATGPGGAKRANILGAKKNQKLGAKKVVGEEIDFEAAEKAAKAEAERIEKLGYDPEAEQAEDKTKRSASAPGSAKRVEVTSAASTNATAATSSTKQHQRSSSEIERLGMGMGRLGFGQVGKPGAAAAAAAAPKKMGFGSVGAPKAAAQEGKFSPSSSPSLSSPLQPNSPNHLSPNLQKTMNCMRAKNSAPKKASRATNSSAATHSTQPRKPKHAHACRASRAPPRSHPTRTLADPKTTCRTRSPAPTTSRPWPRTLSAAWESPPATTWRISSMLRARAGGN